MFDGTGAPLRENTAILVEDGIIRRVADDREACPDGARPVDVGQRVLMPGLTDVHTHASGRVPKTAEGAASMRAARQAGVKIALGSDMSLAAGLEIQRMVHHGLTPGQALAAATKTAAEALDLDEHIGTATEGKLTDLLIVDGDPLQDPHLLADPGRIWLVLQGGVPVAGQALTILAP
jgi:imidazolonepropionase-like amidohydrolase